MEGIDGMGHVHQCRDSKLLKEIVQGSETTPRKAELLGLTTVLKVPGKDSEEKAWAVSES